MKIAISSTDTDRMSKVDLRFGRAKQFMVYDTEAKSWSVLENRPQMDLPQGAGIQTGQILTREGINAVITGHCGPNAWKVLSSAGIQVYFVASITVEEAVKEFEKGSLKQAGGSDVQGHW